LLTDSVADAFSGLPATARVRGGAGQRTPTCECIALAFLGFLCFETHLFARLDRLSIFYGRFSAGSVR
jgi:hypothetical protein